MSISKKVRFEVFKRDKFTCQYCGRSAPDIILEVDHIEPKSKGGDDDILNYVTSCFECNRGKSNVTLSDDSAIKKRKAQLDELQERREQLEMLMEWHRSLIDLDNVTITELCNLWNTLVPGYHINEKGTPSLKLWVRRYGLNEVIESMKLSVERYMQLDKDGHPQKDTVEQSFQYIPKICHSRKVNEQKPYMLDLYYIRGILANRFNSIDKKNWKCIKLMEEAYLNGVSIEDIKQSAISSQSWREFANSLEQEAKNG